MTNIEDTRQVEDLGETAALRGIVNPLKTKIELSQGNLRIQEHVVYNGQVKVAQATAGTNGNECTWMYVQGESNDGASLTLTAAQTRQLRDLLTEVLELQGEE